MAYITVIEIDSEILKVVHARGDSKGVSVEKILTHSVKGLTKEATASAITQLINKNALKIDKLIAMISRKDLAIRMLVLPSANKAELQQMASLEAVKQIPFSAEDTVFDYRVMQTNEEGYSQVILAIVHKNVVNNVLEILNKAGLKPDILTLTTEGLFSWARVVLSKEIESKRPVLIMDIDRNNVEIEVISGQNILLNRVSSFGAVSLAESAPEHQSFRERLLLEIRRSIDAYNKEQKKTLPIEKLVITGSQEAANAVAGMFKDELAVDTSIIENKQGFDVTSQALPMEQFAQDISIASTLGAAFLQDMQALNILPMELKKKQEFIQHSKKIIIMAVLSASLFIMLSAATVINFYQKKALLQSLKASVKKIAPVTDKLEAKFKRLELIGSHTEAAKRSLIFLYELHKVIPDNVLLNYLNFDKKGKIILQGTTPAMADVFKFVNMLEKSNKFKEVQTGYVSKRTLKDRETVDFQITCEMSL